MKWYLRTVSTPAETVVLVAGNFPFNCVFLYLAEKTVPVLSKPTGSFHSLVISHADLTNPGILSGSTDTEACERLFILKATSEEKRSMSIKGPPTVTTGLRKQI